MTDRHAADCESLAKGMCTCEGATMEQTPERKFVEALQQLIAHITAGEGLNSHPSFRHERQYLEAVCEAFIHHANDDWPEEAIQFELARILKAVFGDDDREECRRTTNKLGITGDGR